MTEAVILVETDLIDVGDRLRSLNSDHVALLVASIQDRGQDTPVKITPPNAQGRHRLIVGGHRFAACRQLNRAIEAIVFVGGPLEQRLLEIDENLIRRELSALDRAVFLAERKVVHEHLHPHTVRGKHDRKAKANSGSSLAQLAFSFTAETAALLGVSQRMVQRIAARAAIAPDVRALIAPLPIAARGPELDALSRCAVADQRLIARWLVDHPAGRVAAAMTALGLRKPTPPPSPSYLANRELRRLQALPTEVRAALGPLLRKFPIRGDDE